MIFLMGINIGNLSAQRLFDNRMNTESYYSTGYYYMKDSSVIKGLIKYTFLTPDRFRFKDSLTAPAVTITADDCIGFFEDGDKARFETLSNVKLPGLMAPKLNKCFAELRIAGDLSLYMVYFTKPKKAFAMDRQINGPNVEPGRLYVLTKKGTDTVLEVPQKGKQFRKELSTYLADKPGIVAFINSNDYTEDEIEMIVQAYNKSK